MIKFFKKPNTIIIFLIIVLSFSVRIYRIDNPVADWHSWRQADTSAVTRNYVKHGINLLFPIYDDLSNIPSGKDNPHGYRFVEFPLYNAETAIAYKLLPFLSIEEWGRLITVFASLGTLVFLYLLARKYYGNRAGLLSALFFAVIPYNIYYSRTILPDPHLVFTTTAAIYFFNQWIEKEKFRDLFLATIFFAAGLLFKTYAIFLLPVFAYLAINKYKLKAFCNPFIISFILISFIPIAFWRYWMLQFPEGVPAYTWLLNGNGIRFHPAFFRWILYERLTRLILGFSGVLFLVVGFFRHIKQETWLFYVWALSLALYVIVIATGNVQHDYYQIFLIPIVCIFLGKGIDLIIQELRTMKAKIIGISLIILASFFMIQYSWSTIKTYYWINNPAIIEAGKMVDNITPPDARIIAPYGGDTSFLYQTNRQGWPQGFDIEKKIAMGASYYVNINLPDAETKYVENKWQVVKKTDKYVIVKLK